jgi:type IV pilus assembly protein PilF
MNRKICQLLVVVGVIFLLIACAGRETKLSDEENPDNAEKNVQLALHYLKEGNPQHALNKVLLALKQNPELDSAYDAAGRIYAEHNQPDLAEKYYKRAIELMPQDATPYNHYGQFLCNEKRFQEAEEVFLKGIKTETANAAEVAYANAGLCAIRVPDLERAAGYFRSALNVNPKMAVPYYQLARIDFKKEQFSQAQRNLQSYLHYGVPTPKSLSLGIEIEGALGDTELQTEYARQLKENFPNAEETQQLMLQYPDLYMSITAEEMQEKNSAPKSAPHP